MSKHAALSTSLWACSWLSYRQGHVVQPSLYHNPIRNVASDNMTQTLYCHPDLKLPAECDPPNITDDGKCKAVPYFVNVLRENILFTTESILKCIASSVFNYKVQSPLSNWKLFNFNFIKYLIRFISWFLTTKDQFMGCYVNSNNFEQCDGFC